MADNRNEVNLENSEKKKPISKIKTKNIILIACGIVAVLMVALFRMSANQKKMMEQEKVVEKTQENNEVESTNLGFDVIDYSKTVKEEDDNESEEQQLTYFNEKAPEEEIEEPRVNVEEEIKKNEKREAYYETLLSDELSARSSVIEFGIESTQNNNNNNNRQGELPIINMSTDLSQTQLAGISDDINKQPEKKAFLDKENSRKNYNEDVIHSPISKYEVKAGGIIPGILVTGINSDLPGSMTALVREDVYDTVTGRHLLIPKGTRVIGKYSSSISFGQSRILVVWQRIIFPNGNSINLENFEGADMSGYAGLVGEVDNHTLKLFQGVILSSILGAAAGIIDDNGNSNNNNSWRNNAGRGAGEEIVTIGEAIAGRLLAVQPTIKIAPGSRFNIMVNSDLVLEPYKE